MDFFSQQDQARKHTGMLIVCFVLATLATILLVYYFPMICARIFLPIKLWHPHIFCWVCGVTLTVVLGGSLYKIAQLRRDGGAGVAQRLGGKNIHSASSDFYERRLRNVVEEMAIASGVPIPPIFVMPRERGINAFAAGFTPYDSVIAVTFGAMTCLGREELQGVIAHEFSHILNADVGMNCKLMGFLHGLMLIGDTGRYLIRNVGSSRTWWSRRSSAGGIEIILAGVALWVVGAFGLGLSKLIQSLISCQREILADASAVQFTRNPGGLAGALKKIGGLEGGSTMISSHASQISHMCFGNSLHSSRWFSTHPPLTQRIQWLDPSFRGNFKPVTLNELQKMVVQFEDAPSVKVEPTTLKNKAAVLTAVAMEGPFVRAQKQPHQTAEEVMASIGRPTQKNVDHARQLIASIPVSIQTAARDGISAQALVYLLLLDDPGKTRDWQRSLLNHQAAPETYACFLALLPFRDRISDEMRLPLIDLCMPSLRLLSPHNYAAFRSLSMRLVVADDQVDVFEYALLHLLLRNLDQLFSDKKRRPVVQYYEVSGLAKEISCVLSALARRGHADPVQARQAFHTAAKKIVSARATFVFLSEENCTWPELDKALDRLNTGSLPVKKWLLAAALVCLMHDGQMTVEEVELFRAIASTLDCPVPPWVTPSA